MSPKKAEHSDRMICSPGPNTFQITDKPLGAQAFRLHWNGQDARAPRTFAHRVIEAYMMFAISCKESMLTRKERNDELHLDDALYYDGITQKPATSFP